MKKLLLFFISACFILPCFSKTIILKSGKTIQGKILEKTDNSVKVDIEGIPITYYFDEVQSIDGIASINNETAENNLSQPITTETPSSGIDTEHIHKILKHLGYSENTWPAIEKELIAFLIKIDYLGLKQEVAQAKSSPERLKQFVSKLGRLFMQEGCLNIEPVPLIKLLITTIADDDIFQVIETSTISPEKKEKSKAALVSCSAVSQLGAIILNLLDINTKNIVGTEHVFNSIPLGSQQILFADFTNQMFEIVDINQYYNPEGKCLVLKEQYRMSPEKTREIFEQWDKGVRPGSLKEILNQSYYFNICITDDYIATADIYNNYGSVYIDKGNYEQAILNLNKATEINPNLAESYSNLGAVYNILGQYQQSVEYLKKATQINPNSASAYRNLGASYYRLSQYDQATTSLQKSIQLDPNNSFTYSNLGACYYKVGQHSQAIAYYQQAIKLDPDNTDAYAGAGYAYSASEQPQQAIIYLQKAIQLNPNDADVNYILGLDYKYFGQQQLAKETLQKAKELFTKQGNYKRAQEVEEHLKKLP